IPGYSSPDAFFTYPCDTTRRFCDDRTRVCCACHSSYQCVRMRDLVGTRGSVSKPRHLVASAPWRVGFVAKTTGGEELIALRPHGPLPLRRQLRATFDVFHLTVHFRPGEPF